MVTRHDLALLRLVAQRVVGPSFGAPAYAVRHLGAVQAQDLPGALTSIALRTADGSLDAVRAAFDDGAVVRTWPMRGTLHAVQAHDAAWMVELMRGGPMTAMARRREELGITDAHVDVARRTVVEALSGGRAMVRAEVLDLWRDAGLELAPGHGYHLLVLLAHEGLLVLGPLRGKDQAFVLHDEWVQAPRRLDRDEALVEIATRYAVSHGPATDRDLARWTGLPLRDVRAGLAGAGDLLTTVEVDGVPYHLDPTVPDLLADHRADAQEVLLLPGFDEMVLGYADRSVTVPPEHAARIVPGKNGVFRPTVLHDGVAVATWRWVGTGRNRRVEVDPFTTLDDRLRARVEERAAAMPR